MARITANLSAADYKKLEKKAKQEGVSAATMLAILLDRGDNHLKMPKKFCRKVIITGDAALAN